jgi:hypothetical protein
MDELTDFIHVYEEALDAQVCEFLIDFFDQMTDLQERVENDGKPNFTQINLTANCKISDQVSSIHNHLIKSTVEYKDKYYEFADARVFPPSHAFEQFRIKKYNPGGDDLFDTHVDVMDYASSRRYLSFFWYLNDVEVGGQTVFKDKIITPTKGSLLVFPPLWMFPHRGDPPISGPKYLLHTYLHYK